MSTTMKVEFHSIDGTEAAIGFAGSFAVTVDRPPGKAGGAGQGLNGGQLLGLAIGGCLCNDLRYVAHEMGLEIKSLKVEVMTTFEGSPLLATAADVAISCELTNGEDPAELVARARNSSTVANSISRGMEIRYV